MIKPYLMRRGIILMVLVGVTGVVMLTHAWTNTPTPSGAMIFDTDPALNNAEPITEAPTITLYDLILSGGVTLYPLLLLSVWAVGLIIMNMYLIRETRLVPKEKLRPLWRKVTERKLNEALALCDDEDDICHRVLKPSFKLAGQGYSAVSEAIAASAVREFGLLRSRVRWLGDVGSLAPMLGLLGTVIGMIKTFRVVSLDVSLVKPAALSQGVAESLISTAAGLTLAIPAFFFYFYFRSKLSRCLASMEIVSEEFAQTLGTLKQSPEDEQAQQNSTSKMFEQDS